MSWLLSFLPWWVYYLAIAVALAATAQLWLPGALSIWGRMPNWLRLVVGGVVTAVATYFIGANKALREERERERQRDARAIEARRKINLDFDTAKPDEQEKRRQRWDRD